MGIRKDRYKAMVPQVVAPLRLKGRVHADEARVARTHTTRKLKFTLPGPMTIIDTIADRYYGDRVKMAFAFAELLNEEAQGAAGRRRRHDPVRRARLQRLHGPRSATGASRRWSAPRKASTCATAVHICYGYGIKANTDWKETLGGEWRQYEDIFPAIAKSPIQQVAIECRNSQVPLELLGLLPGKIVQAGVIDVASDTVETAEDVVRVIDDVSKFVPKSNIIADHQLRHGADAPRYRGSEADGARRRREACEAAARMMLSRVVLIVLAALAALLPARAGERDQLNACRALVERAAQPERSAPAAQTDAELQRCRQIIKEWTLRDSRMSVDEQGRPLR